MSTYSQGSNKTSSTATTTASNVRDGEDPNITRIKALVLKAAMQVGFNRDAAMAAGAQANNAPASSSSSSISYASDASAGGQAHGHGANSVSTGSTIVPSGGPVGSSPPATPVAALQAFVRSLPTGSFGSLPSHATLLQNYKNLVLADPSINSRLASASGNGAAASSWASLPPKGKRVTAYDMARAVAWMNARGQHYGFLRDLFRLVFGFHIDEAEIKKNVSIMV